MSSIHTVLVFALVAAASFTPVYALEFCQSTDRDCHSDDNMASDTVKSRWNMRASNLIQDLDQFNVSCKKLTGKTDSCLSIFFKTEANKVKGSSAFCPLCRSIPGRWGRWQLCPHCKELRILQIQSNPAEGPIKTGSSFQGGVITSLASCNVCSVT